jgi:hypothetical protein
MKDDDDANVKQKQMDVYLRRIAIKQDVLKSLNGNPG